MKTTDITAIVLCAAGIFSPFIQSTSAETRAGEGTRIDYINAKGERFWSTIAEPGYVYFKIHGNEDGYNVFCPQTMDENSTPVRIRFVRPGEENHSLTVSSENDNVKVSYEVIEGGTTRAGELPYGATVRLSVTVPKESYPLIHFHDVYTGTSATGEKFLVYDTPLEVYSLPYIRMDRWHEYADNRQFEIDNRENPDGWERDASNPDKWHLTFQMPNEPLEIMASCIRPDYTMLRQAADNALSELYSQHSEISLSGGNNGEGSIMNLIGDYLSQDYISYRASTDFESLMSNPRLDYSALPWYNAFIYINHANLMLRYLDRFTAASEAERQTVRGQMLVLRSYGYLRLMQCYGPRWSDRTRSRLVAPLYDTYSPTDAPLATMEDIYQACRNDLMEAEQLLTDNRTNFNEPDRNVARGVRMRLEMLAENWVEAAELAEKILDVKPLTTNDELKSGFFNPAESWLWGSDGKLDGNELLYYWSWNAINACNGIYPATWNIPAGAIDKDLYLSIPETDVRRSLFVMPDQLPFKPYSTMGAWYNPKYMDTDKLSASISGNLISYYSKMKPEGVEYPAFKNYGKYTVPIQFGAQMKYYAPNSNSWEGTLLFMRSDEALLSAAEAYFHLGDEAKAKDFINQLNIMRNPSYFTVASGEELLAEIRKTRKIELWGEGHSWFDQKRWSLPITRRHWVEGDSESGNWYPSITESIDVDSANGWRFPIPKYIVVWNELIDINTLGYIGVEGYEDTSVNAPRKAAPQTTAKQTEMPSVTIMKEMQSVTEPLLKTVEY